MTVARSAFRPCPDRPAGTPNAFTRHNRHKKKEPIRRSRSCPRLTTPVCPADAATVGRSVHRTMDLPEKKGAGKRDVKTMFL